ncbi:site-specific DNA-methyltransferase [Frankia tisae]|uniref:site-specific DNA-methyltransferase n=1 Tax=Frankia tisae TaxID=2950104 RepID=UPI0021C1AB93|nr:site-specific DNA-methyltransferase [Frankia tisae]
MTTDRAPRADRWCTVWPTGRHAPSNQVAASGHQPTSSHHGNAITPAVAAYAIATYSRPGDTVCDPDCGPGTVVAEAAHAGRHAIGITHDPRWWEYARTTVTLAKARGARGDGMILDNPPDPRTWTGLGPIDLVLTAIGPHSDPDDQAGFGLARDRPGPDRLRARLAAYSELPWDDGLLVVIVEPVPIDGIDLASRVVTAGRDVGLRPVQRCVALTAVPYTQTLSAARPRAGARAYPVHQDVIVFRSAAGRRTQPPTTPDPPPATPAPAVRDTTTPDRLAA